jgi:hypothetical protein
MKKYFITDELYYKLMDLVSLDTAKKVDLYKKIGIPKHTCSAILYRRVKYISSDLLTKFEEYFNVNLHMYVEDIEKTAITKNEIDKLQSEVVILRNKLHKLYIHNYEALIKNLQLLTESQYEIDQLKKENKELKRLLAEKQ